MTPGRYDIRRFAEVDSTNRYLLDEAVEGAPEGLVAVADHQSAGRGRLDRRWEAPPGRSLLLSVLLRPDLEPDQLQVVPGLLALAGIGACHRITGVAPSLKWPNDLVVGDRKLAGILAEVGGFGPHPQPAFVVVGMGLNVAWPGPPEAQGTCLEQEAGRPVDREALLVALLEDLALLRPSLDTPLGRDQLVGEMRRGCRTLGQRVRVTRVGREAIEGRAVSLTDRAQLVVDSVDGPITIDTGDVVHVRPGGPGGPGRPGGPGGPGRPGGPGGPVQAGCRAGRQNSWWQSQ